MQWAREAQNEWKDILIVVHDQLQYFKECIETIQKHTTKYRLYIWDNNSGEETQAFIQTILDSYVPEENLDWSVEVIRSDENIGFLQPNNEMAKWGTSPYIILLNSDCRVMEGWDKAMLGCLQQNPEIGQVGYLGGVLGADGKGYRGHFGYDIDYVCGWGFCITRELYNKQGLFDPIYKFAYYEDSDFSLRVQLGGAKIYALHLGWVYHYGNKTIMTVMQEGEVDTQLTFDYNQQVFLQRWADYIQNYRIDVRPLKE
jgi:GT2 family glycosyltransferase